MTTATEEVIAAEQKRPKTAPRDKELIALEKVSEAMRILLEYHKNNYPYKEATGRGAVSRILKYVDDRFGVRYE